MVSTSHYTATIYENNLSPPETTAPECGLDLLNMGLLHIRYVFDTGASPTLSPTQVHGSLRSSGPSRLEIIEVRQLVARASTRPATAAIRDITGSDQWISYQ